MIHTAVAGAAVTNLLWIRGGESDVGLRTWSVMQNGGDNLVRDDVIANNNQGWYANAGMSDGWGGTYATDTPDASHLRHATSTYSYHNIFAWRPVVSAATDSFGMEIWVKADNVTDSGYIFHNGNGNGVGFYKNGDHYAVHIPGVLMADVAPASTTIWTHLAIVRDSVAFGGMKLFVDGMQAGFIDSVVSAPSGELVIGLNPWTPGGDEFFLGNVDEARIFTFMSGQFVADDLNYAEQCSGVFVDGDVNNDCVVNIVDFAVIVQNWLDCNNTDPPCNYAPSY